jgi:1-acyl-sn-glycerol-3-phosphate acyltransferase
LPSTPPKPPPGTAARSTHENAETGASSLLWLVPYTLLAAAVFLALALLALLLLLLVPTLRGRRLVTRATGRCALALMGMPVSVHWRGVLPAHCIVVANHCSYLDGVVLAATLPPRFGFVIKREMSRVPLAGLLLSRIGSYFVERGNRAGSARDALRVMRDAASGSSLAFFPEGTFRIEPGLLRFHTGAFAAAERAQVPVVPLVIRGTRHCLHPGGFLLRPGRIEVQVLDSLWPQPVHEDGAAALRDAARAAILAALGEEEKT